MSDGSLIHERQPAYGGRCARGAPRLGPGSRSFRIARGVPWIIEASGFDYCMIDHQHGAFDLETIADLAGWFQATNVSAIVRIHKSFTYLIPASVEPAGERRQHLA
jgi:hypothetical protein